MSGINGINTAFNMQGGYQQNDYRSGKHGLKISKFTARRLAAEANENLKRKFQSGGSIDNEEQPKNKGKNFRTFQELVAYANDSSPRFVQRFKEEPKCIMKDGNPVSHILRFLADAIGHAFVFPEIQEDERGELHDYGDDALEMAKKHNDFLEMTPDEAEDFVGHYKEGWPDYFKMLSCAKPKPPIKKTTISITMELPDYQDDMPMFQRGGQINVIPDGALHATKNNMDDENLTKKGIPVVDNDGTQQAEIERDEIILRLDVTKKLEENERKYFSEGTTNEEKQALALETGKMLAYELTNNTVKQNNKPK